MNVSLTPELAQFVRAKVESGQYRSVAAVLCEGLRLIQERDRTYKGRFEELRQEIMLGIAASDQGNVLAGEATMQRLREKFQSQYHPPESVRNVHILTFPTKQDIEDISTGLQGRNSDAAERFLDALTQRFRTLANFPKMGRRRDEIFPLLRSFPVEDCLIFYRPIDKGAEVVRVIRSYSDLEFLFQD